MAVKDYTLKPEQIPQVCPIPVSAEERDTLKAEIAQRLKELGAVLVAHYYVDGDVQDIAQACVFLLSDAARQITGQILDVDGGNHLMGGGFTPMTEQTTRGRSG